MFPEVSPQPINPLSASPEAVVSPHPDILDRRVRQSLDAAPGRAPSA